MSLNKQQLEAVNQANFPDNNSKFITPELLREFNTDMIDAIQLTGSYATTGSNTFVGNQTITGNLSVSGVISASVLYVQTETASVIYSSGSNQLGDELTDIQTLSGSVKIQGQLLINGVPLTSGSTTDTGSLVTTASFNAYTQSTNLRLNSLETNSASVNVSISNLNGTTASLNTSVTALNQFTQSQAALNGTFATTGSNTFTGNQVIDRAYKLYTNGIYWTDVTAGFNNLEIINQGGGNLDLAALNGGKVRIVNTPLVLTGSALSSSNDISTSANIYAANLTGSGVLPAGVISSSAQITSLGFVSSSVTASSLVTASVAVNVITFTKGDGSTFNLSVVSSGSVTPGTISGSAQITALGFVSSSVTASSLITASFDNGTRNLTFTKGDASTFNVNIPDVSGSTINTGSFATTGSNTFVGNQNVNGQLIADTAGNQLILKSGENGTTVFDQQPSGSPYNGILRIFQTSGASGIDIYTNVYITGSLTASLQEGYVWVGDSSNKTKLVPTSSFGGGGSINTGSFATTSSFNAYTASTDGRLNNIESTTASLLIETQNLELFSASALTSLSNLNIATASLFTSTSLSLTTASVSGQTMTFTKGDGTTFNVTLPTGSGGGTIDTGSFATTGSNAFSGSNTFNGNFSIITDPSVTNVIISASADDNNDRKILSVLNGTAIFPQSGSNFQYDGIAIGARSGSNTSAAVAEFAVDYNQGPSLFWTPNRSDSANFNRIRFTSLNDVTQSVQISTGLFQLYNNGSRNIADIGKVISFPIVPGTNGQYLRLVDDNGTVGFSSFNSGSFATTGSNTFTGDQTFIDNGGNFFTITDTSGSMMLVAKSFTSASLHLTSSFTNSINLIFKNSDTTSDTIISGSNNIFSNPGANTAGFKRFLGNFNLALNPVILPQVSASMGNYVIFNNNTLAGSAGFTLRGPVSSSVWTMSGNTLNNTGAFLIGSAAATNAQQMVSGFAMSNNVGNGFLRLQAYKTPLSASVTYSTSTAAGVVDLNLHSSSINYSGNISFGGTTINNLYFPTTVNITSSIVSVNSCQFLGSNNIIFSGSNASMTGETRRLQSSLIVGFNSASLVLNGDSGSMFATSILGAGLIVTGSNSRYTTLNLPNNDYGSVFVGRYNSNDGITNKTAETIFVVGTGTSNSARKTGFLIDSGSNSYFEGSLNVSGSTSLTGSLTIQSGSALFVNGNRQFNVGAFSSLVSQSGSANVSQSMNFEVTDISQGVSIVSNSRITLANSGTYNIQFSAQVDRVAGSGTDTIHIWLKKNGTNVSASAGAITVSGGVAAAKTISSWNYVVDASAGDYYEIVWQPTDANLQLITAAATGNIPSIPSIILTVTQVR